MSDARLAGDWRAYSADIGTHATLIENGMRFSGRVLDVDPAEGLLVQLDTGARRHFDPATTSRVLA
jgi:biotin-(acetyl-CoA carboxylase) ligase